MTISRFALVSDFGQSGPYIGQVKLVLRAALPALPVVDLVSGLPPFRPDLAAYLLAQLPRDLPRNTCYLAVVDPGVGGERQGLVVSAGGNWYVGPDNGLLALVVRRHEDAKVWRIDWVPPRRSPTFHGRDWFAPLAVRLAAGESVDGLAVRASGLVGSDWPDELQRVVFLDVYGNLCTGLRASAVDEKVRFRVGDRLLDYARTFCAVSPGVAFWYENSFGLVEFAVNQGRADMLLGLVPGDGFAIEQGNV